MEWFANISRHLKLHKKPVSTTLRAAPAVCPSTAHPIKFEVRGDKIINHLNQEVTFKGIVTTVKADNLALSEQAIQAMAKRDNNVIRLNFNQDDWLASGSVDVEGSYKQMVDTAIYHAIRNNMAVILNLQQSNTNSSDNHATLQAWQEIASTYKNFGTVIFQLFDRLAGVNPHVWLNGGFGHIGYQTLYDTIRNEDANNPVIINGLNNSSDLSFVNDFNVNGHNIIYCTRTSNKKGDNLITGYKDIIGKFPLIFYDKATNYISSVNRPRVGGVVLKPTPTVTQQFWKAPVQPSIKPQHIPSQIQSSYREEVVHGLLTIQNKFNTLPPAKPCQEVIKNSLALCKELNDKHASLDLLEDILLTARYEIRKAQPSYSLHLNSSAPVIKALNDLLSELTVSKLEKAKTLRM